MRLKHVYNEFRKKSKYILKLSKCVISLLSFCALWAITPETDFLIVPDRNIPGVNAFIGWEIINCPGVKVLKGEHRTDLQHIFEHPNIRAVRQKIIE